ncbi:MAG TPA: nuclear transport factor 2 family protein [Thermoleophilaceae bacterium]|nr:nuclear transport factor 2 family protein [Thermoleophilaceae bacterium]
MARACAALAALALGLGGCGGSDSEPRLPAPPPSADDLAPDPPGPRPSRNASDAEVIRGWSAALNAGRFEHAASFFAPGAVIEQGLEETLDTRAEAIAFNASLPCRGEVTDIEDEGATSLAAFRLGEGRGGACPEGGVARVRFRIDDGLIHEWRQLAEDPAAGAGSA